MYLNLARRLTLIGIHQLWVADITAIRLRTEFVYLVVLLDGSSRKVGGWALDKTLARLPLGALHRAITARQPPPGMVHRSDRGNQYGTAAYQWHLVDGGIQCSMSRLGNCWDNAVVESFFATLKTTLRSKGHPLSTRQEARTAIFEYVEGFYNRARRHSALGYLCPWSLNNGLLPQSTVSTESREVQVNSPARFNEFLTCLSPHRNLS